MKYIFNSILIFTLISCSSKEVNLDANGVFESTEITISAQNPGELTGLYIDEGNQVTKEDVLAQVDSTSLSLTKLQLLSQVSGLEARLPNIASNLKTLKHQISGLKKDQQRIQNMYDQGAATSKQLDDVNTKLASLKSTYAAQKDNLTNQNNSLVFQIDALEEQVKLIEYQISKSTIKAPIDGVVLVKFVEQNEMVGAGRPLMRIADLQHMTLKAYLNTEQLKDLKIGQKVTVFAEYGAEGKKELPGSITWISSESEFTPKTIQTQDERANLVYAVKVAVDNKDGLLRIGMYGGFKIK